MSHSKEKKKKQLEISFPSSWAEEQREVRPENHNCVVKSVMEANTKLVWRPEKNGSIHPSEQRRKVKESLRHGAVLNPERLARRKWHSNILIMENAWEKQIIQYSCKIGQRN